MRPRPDLAGELDQTTLLERRRALRALLRKPLRTSDGDAEEFVYIRRHGDHLATWLWRYPGWRLELNSELARLHKIPPSLDDGTRPARPPKAEPFSRRRYVLLCLALAVLERSDRQTVLGALADGVLDLAASDPHLAAAGVEFHLENRDQRRDLVAVVRFLLDLQVLVKVDGDEHQYVDGKGDVLYDIHRSVLASLLDIRRAPSTIEDSDLATRLRLLTEEPLPDSTEGRNRRRRTHLYRQLLDDPVLYFDTLDEDSRNYLRSQRVAIIRQIENATGLRAEVRREGIAMVDERGQFSDIGLPEEGTDGHLTLLLAEYLADRLRAAADRPQDDSSTGLQTGLQTAPPVAIGLAALEQTIAELIRVNRRRWAKRVREPGAPAVLLRQTLDRLEALRLVRRIAGGVVPLPAVCRYALDQEDSL